MAHIEKLGARKYKAAYRDPNGREKTRTFASKVLAQTFLDNVGHAKSVGGYIDPAKGRETFSQYAERWLAVQVNRQKTLDNLESNIRLHMLPTFGRRQLASIRTSDVQAWVKKLDATHAPNTVRVTYRQLAQIFAAAVLDEVIVKTPCPPRGIKLPEIIEPEVVPLTVEDVHALMEAAPLAFYALVLLAACSGLREGELLGLTVDRIDWLRKTIRVDRQMITPKQGAPHFGPPKSKRSFRTVPVSQFVIDALNAHLRQFPSDDLVFPNQFGGARSRRVFTTSFKAMVRRAGLSSTGENAVTCHDLRHHYASLLIHQGLSVTVVARRLGDAEATVLKTYAHLWPDSDDQTRDAVESAWEHARSASIANNPRPFRGLKAV